MEGDPQHERGQLIALVVQHFQTLSRGPYKVDQALQAAKQADANSTPGIILGESETAWRAYYAAKKATESQHGFSGKAEFARLLNSLSTQSIELQRAFARELALAMESDASQPIEGDGDSGVRKSAKRRQQVPSSVAIQEGVHMNASLKASRTLFPIEFMDSIQRVPSSRFPDTLVADISMFLQRGHIRDHFGCQMEIGIAKEKVAFYAKKLFNMEVEGKDGVRYIRFEGGSKIEPDPCIKLRACRRDAITDVFGADVDHGFSTSPIYQRERREERAYTDGVSMTISNQEKEGGRITLFLGEWRAFDIKRNLYDKY
ncbi:hypothetical protein BU23DRAFT_579088 [Bimuria novae-zelandiae CBS 107.79]|uniref:Uncharacterized protein n=1 Tax=Bimuria novae-zelandiae CBS 107.79 TaxID=1447943 RepID=A0A6A5VFD3_9PLEO|nr:hypothetical protein BU23DRAFT_579088 [Bimuria novae-zelandiae CBS 107.79]